MRREGRSKGLFGRSEIVGTDDMKFTAGEIASCTGGRLVGPSPDMVVEGASTDSREIRTGQVFFALSGPHFDGHDFVVRAVGAGAVGAVVGHGRAEALHASMPGGRAAFLVEVREPLRALADLASLGRSRFKGAVVAVTGSNGKTTTKELADRILSRGRPTGKTAGNFNNLIGMPRTILNLSGTEAAWVLELGINQEGEMDRLAEVSSPTVGVLTSLSETHLAGLGSVEGIAAEKGKLFARIKGDGVAVVPYGHPLESIVLRDFRGRVVRFGVGVPADVRAEKLCRGTDGRLEFTLQSSAGSRQAALPHGSEPALLNSLAAAAAALELGASLDDVVPALAEFSPIRGRLNVHYGRYVIVDDSYNANPASMSAALKFLKQEIRPDRAICCLGDMRELGKASERWHRAVGNEAATLGYDRVIAVGRMAPWVAEGAKDGRLPPDRIHPVESIEEALTLLERHAVPGDGILVKGSRAMGMERLVEGLRAMEDTARGRSS